MMKRTVLSIILVIVFACCLTACGCQHQWDEATCTAPKTCRLCAATEGEILPHEWKEATCTAPRTCRQCSLTEGDVTEHNIVKANYQTGEHCADCGVVLGEPVTAEFVRTGRNYQTLDLSSAHGNTYPYTTGKNNHKQAADCDVTVSWAVPMEAEVDTYSTAINCYVPDGVLPKTISVVNLHSVMPDQDGYTWRGINAVIDFDRGNLIWGYEDYYDLTQYDEDSVTDSSKSGSTEYMITTSTFSVDWNAKTYEDCRLFSVAIASRSCVELYVFYRVPDDYDGCVLSFIDSRILADRVENADAGFTTYDNTGHGAGDVCFRLK